MIRDWPMAVPIGDEITILARKVSSSRDAIVRWSLRLVRGTIQVPPMSDAWLQTHEAEYAKRGDT
jgi:hypothetical protein